MGILSDLLKSLFKIIKKYFWIILIILIIILAIYFPAALALIWSWIQTAAGAIWSWIGTLSFKQLAILGLGVSAAVAPEWTGDRIADGAEWVSDTVIGVGGSVIKGLANSPLAWIAVAGLVWWLWPSGDEKEEVKTLDDTSSTNNDPWGQNTETENYATP